VSGDVPVVLATGNAGKVREFNRLLAGAFAVRPLPPGIGLPPETGETFAANARIKADWVFRRLNGAAAVLADDSGLEVPALGGRPGIYSARFAGEDATDAENVAKLLAELRGASSRDACFVCALCLLSPATSGAEDTVRRVEVQGATPGTIIASPRGDDGFGYDPVFQPEGWELTLAEVSPEDKDRVSHRGAAVRALLECLARKEGE
jgi:non-canonical purine NTP pyrophosphatase (RdgB/HAM1 family)